MHKAYDSVGLVKIKMCSHFINFFGNIHKKRTNRVMTDFGLTDGYIVHNGLDQEEMFLPLLWRIFYDSLFCEVKKHEHFYGYRMCSKFFTRTGKSNLRSDLTFFFAAGTFVNDTIWVGNCLTTMQNILNIASEFFAINNILINTEKTVAIPINQGVRDAVLSISGSRILVARKDESHRYLGIFLSTNGLSKPSLAKAHVDVKFFSNVVLRKAITEKQFLYLVLAVLQSIDRLLRKGLKFKANLPKNFPSEVLHHSEFYEMKTFKQVLTENLLTNLVNFANASRILDTLASSTFSDYIACLSFELFSGAIHAFASCNLFLSAGSSIPILDVLGLDIYISVVKSLKWYGFVFANQILNQRLISTWFMFLSDFVRNSGLGGGMALASYYACANMSCKVSFISEHVFVSGSNFIEVYTDSSVKGMGTIGACSGTAVYFPVVDMSIRVKVHGLLSSTLVELQAITLALECVPAYSIITLYTDSQVSLDICELGVSASGPDFHKKCWLEKKHICYSISKKNLLGHSGVVGNEQTDFFANTAVTSKSVFSFNVLCHFFGVKNQPILDNVCHFVRSLFNVISFANWEFKCTSGVVDKDVICTVDMNRSFSVWHPDNKIWSGYTSSSSASLYSYLMKSLHCYLPVTMKKRLYNSKYPSVLCIRCGLVENLDHFFLCVQDDGTREALLLATRVKWCEMVGCLVIENIVIKSFCEAGSAGGLYMMLAKEFVLKSCVADAARHFGFQSDSDMVIGLVYNMVKYHRSSIWLSVAKLRSFYEKHGLLSCDGFAVPVVVSLSSVKPAEVICSFGIRLGIYVCFGLHPHLSNFDFSFLSHVPVVDLVDV
ncbi:hypothetical protein G9A89_020898 [Geosiphon pyriformis]|nr:hypothetical protein G9A89_020898 [Geosiphon pyriformis]